MNENSAPRAKRDAYPRKAEKEAKTVSGLVLVVDDQIKPRRLLINELEKAGFTVIPASDGEEAWERFCADGPDLVITDMAMPRCDGLELLRRIRSRSETPVIVFSGYGSVETAAEAFKAGADDFVNSLDLDIEDLVNLVRTSIRNPQASPALPDLERRIAGDSETMTRVRWQMSGLAPLGTPVLVSGEAGTGRRSVIRALHELGFSADGPLASLDAEEFKLPFRLDAPGALYLANIEALSEEGQAYWANRIQHSEQEAYRGRLRFFASTQRQPAELADEGFHPALLRTLLRFHIELPALQSRSQDIPAIAEVLSARIGERLGRSRIRLSPAAVGFLSTQRYPGNVRQLEQILERAVAFTRGRIIRRDALKDIIDDFQQSITSIRDQASSLERQSLIDAIHQSGGNISRAATRLGKSRPALYRMMRKYDIPIQRSD